ncbi:MAG: DinB family protein [Ignavibacteria bacterium]|nr:DinB family protein [Ignavibacteria bacterium]
MVSPVNAYIRDLDAFFYSGNNWQPALMELLSKVTPEEAYWRPAKGRNSICEILRHSNFWKRAVICRLRKEPMSPEERRKGSWKRIRKPLSERQWAECMEETVRVHEELKIEIRKHGRQLHNISSNVSNYTREIINHESYHSGQISMIRAMLGKKAII